MGKNLPARCLAVSADFFGINRHYNALGTKTVRGRFYKVGVKHRCWVDTYFICTRIKHDADILHRANTTAHRERDKHFAGDLFYRMYGGRAAFMGGGDIKKGNLICTFLVVALGNFHRITSIADIQKLHAFHHATIVDIKAGNYAFCECHKQFRN